VISEIDLCRVANLMLTRYGHNAEVESAVRADELTARSSMVTVVGYGLRRRPLTAPWCNSLCRMIR
jgi:hypothetical protein